MSFFYTKMSFLTPKCHFRRLNVIFHHLLFFITKVQYLPLNVILATLIFCAAHSGYPVVKFCQDFYHNIVLMIEKILRTRLGILEKDKLHNLWVLTPRN